MNNLKSNLFIIMIAFVLVLAMEYLFLQHTKFMQDMNANFIDTAFSYRGTQKADKRIVIVDVDEKSLKRLGQWPWSRNKIAKILQNLSDADVAIIGLDMVFAEKDSSSPINIAKEANISVNNVEDFDAILAKTLSQTPTISGFVLDFQHNRKNEAPASNAMYIEHGKTETSYILNAKGITTNIPVLQNASYASGCFNTFPDGDGVVRYVPLVFSYDDSIYSSLSLEIVRTLLGVKKVDIFYDENGVSSLKMGDLEIPTDENGRLFVNYKGGAKSYQYMSAIDIYNNTFDKEAIQGSIILLGTSASGLLDLRATPFDSVYPGVEVHANAIDNMINADIIAAPSYMRGVTIVAIMINVIISALLITFVTPLLAFVLVVGALALEMGYFYDMLFQAHILPNVAYPILSMLLSVFVISFFKIYFENRQKMLISDKFSKKVSPQVAKQLLKSGMDTFAAKESEVTIFFSDVRDFTRISEGFDTPANLITYLNMYMSPMSDIIIKQEGTIDKYIGDAIMAYWNAPLPVKNHADKAVTAAIEQIEALKNLNATLAQHDYPSIAIGIGIHTGMAIAGEMGSKGRSDYTVIGDSINLGSRIEGLCKMYGAKILISEQTKEKLKNHYKLREVDQVQVKGKEEAVRLYEVLGVGEFDAEELLLESLYNEAKKAYHDSQFKEAYALFEQAFSLQEHALFTLYLERCLAYQKRDGKVHDFVQRLNVK